MARIGLRSVLVLVVMAFSIQAASPNEELWAAAKKGDAAAVKALLANGADANAKTAYGVTALLHAAGQGHVEVVKVLLEHKADANIKDTFYGQTPLTAAVGKGSWEIVRLLIGAGATDAEVALPQAAAAGQIEIVKTILQKSTPKPEVLNRALLATPAKHAEVVEILTKAGAKPAAKPEVKSGVAVDPAVLAKYAGTYREPDNLLELTVTLKDQALTGGFEGSPTFALVAVDQTSFRRDTGTPATITFQQENDKVTGLVLKTTRAELKFKRLAAKDVARKPPPVDEPAVAVAAPMNWPSFRGPSASGVADGQHPPMTWDVEKGINVRWKTPIPGLGHSCPVVWGDRVFVTTAVGAGDKAGLRPGLYGDVDSVNDKSEHAWHVYALDKPSGAIVWDVVAHTGIPKVKRHLKGTHANPTPATDGQHVVACFGSEGLFCYDFVGKLLWKHDLGTLDSGWFFDADYQWGFGSSPIIYRDLVIVQCDVGKGSFLAAYRVTDGQEVWQTPREEIPSWGTPTVIEGPNRAELVTNATKFARGYDPMTGKELWRLARHSEITVPTPIAGQGLIFITSGYRPVQPIYAIRPGANGDVSLKNDQTSNDSVAWSTTRYGPYMPTPIVYGEYLYTCANNGVVSCFDAKTGKLNYRERLGGQGGFTASPVAADGKLYFTSEEGGVRVVRAGPTYEPIAVNPLGDICMATPAISDGLFLVRTQKSVIALGR